MLSGALSTVYTVQGRRLPMESFWGSLKNELIHHQRYATRANAESAITEYIEIFYNRQRRHSRLGYLSPASFADNFSNQPLAA
jgi:transposase InsO family protein